MEPVTANGLNLGNRLYDKSYQGLKSLENLEIPKIAVTINLSSNNLTDFTGLNLSKETKNKLSTELQNYNNFLSVKIILFFVTNFV